MSSSNFLTSWFTGATKNSVVAEEGRRSSTKRVSSKRASTSSTSSKRLSTSSSSSKRSSKSVIVDDADADEQNVGDDGGERKRSSRRSSRKSSAASSKRRSTGSKRLSKLEHVEPEQEVAHASYPEQEQEEEQEFQEEEEEEEEDFELNLIALGSKIAHKSRKSLSGFKSAFTLEASTIESSEPFADDDEAEEEDAESMDAIMETIESRWEAAEDPELFVRDQVTAFVTWRHPAITFVWLLIAAQLLFLTTVSGYSFITLSTYILLLQVCVTTFVVKASEELKQSGLLSETFHAPKFATQRQIMSSEEVVIISQGLGQVAAKQAQNWFQDLHNGNGKVLAKHIASLVSSVLIGRFVPLWMVMSVVWFFAFTFPLLYVKQPRFKTFADEQYESIDGLFEVFNVFGAEERKQAKHRSKKAVHGRDSVESDVMHEHRSSKRKSSSSSRRARVSQSTNPMFGN